MRTALDSLGDLARAREGYDQAINIVLEEARAEGYHQALVDCNVALMQGLPALKLLLELKIPPRPVGQEIER